MTSTPSFTIADTSIERGGSTAFTSTFTMDEGTAQATLNVPGLTETFNSGCAVTPPSAGRTCSVSSTGLVTVADGAPVGTVDNVTVTITGTITAGTNFALGSTEGALQGTVPVPGLTITLDQGATPKTSTPAQSITVGTNPDTDAEIRMTTTAPAASGATAGRGTTINYVATLDRVGFLNQATTATATLVADTAAGTTVSVATAPASWIADETADKTVTLTVNVPATLPLGGNATYHIVVTYDPNMADVVDVNDTEVGATRSFQIVAGPGDAVVSIATTAPTEGQDVPRGTNVTYTATLTRTGNPAQVTSVNLSLLPIGDQRGTTPGAFVPVLFADGVTTATGSITVTVPAGATLGNVSYRFQGVYDPSGTDGTPTDTVIDTPRTFDIVAALPTFTLTPGDGNVSRGDTFNLVATLSNPAGAVPITAGIIAVTVPVGMSAGVPVATAGFITPPLPVPPVPGLIPQIVSVTYGTIAAGTTTTLTIPVTVLPSATKKPGADLTVSASFTSAAPVFALNDSTDFEVTPDADIQMSVAAPPEAQLDPDQASVDVTYSVTNQGPDPAAGVSFVATAPTGFVGAVNPNEGGDGADSDTAQDWLCPNIPAGGTSTTCTYQGGALSPGITTATVVITWTFDSTGTKTFPATASTTTNDPAPANNTQTPAASTTISNPTGSVNLVVDATPEPVVVAVDVDAIVTVVHTVTNTGPKNIKATITVTPPSGAFLQSLSGGAGCNIPAETTAAQTCSLGTLNKNGTPVTVTATYRVPQAAFGGAVNKVTFSASIAPVNGNFAPGSTTAHSDEVSGTPPMIDIGLAVTALPGEPVVNTPHGTVPSAAAPVVVTRTFTFSNLSTQYSVRSGTAFIDITPNPGAGVGTIAPTPAPGPPPPVPPTCTATVGFTVRCPVPIPAAAIAPSGSATLSVNIPLITADPVAFTATAVVVDPGNRIADPAPPTPDAVTFSLDVNRTPSTNSLVGPSVPAGGTLGFTPLGGQLHTDNDNDNLRLDDLTNICATPSATCAVVGGTVAGLSATVANDKMTVTFTSSTPNAAATPVTVTITYSVTDGKGRSDSTIKIRLLPAIAHSVEGSFGRPVTSGPKTFATSIDPSLLDSTATPIDVLEGSYGQDANGGIFPGGLPTNIAYDLATVSGGDTLNVRGSSVTRVAGTPNAVARYTPAPAYTSEPPRASIPLPDAPADSFRYQAAGTRQSGTLFTVDATVSAEVRNQQPIGVDDTFDVPNNVSSIFEPALNDLDGNTAPDANSDKKADPIGVTSPSTPSSFVFDDEGEYDTALGLTIKCIGPVPNLLPATGLPETEPGAVCPAAGSFGGGFVGANQPLVLQTPDSKGTVTVTLSDKTSTTTKAFKTVEIKADATVVGDLNFAYVIVDNYGGAAFGRATARVPNTPPQVIEGVRTVLKNTPTLVVDTRLAATDANGDNIIISGAPPRTDHGSIVIGDSNRTITYTPDKDYLGPDKLLYSVTDNRSNGAASAILELNVIEQPTDLAVGAAGGAGGGAAAGGAAGSPAGNLAATGGDPLALTAAAGGSLVLGLLFMQAGRRRQSRPLLAQARHLRT